jgi:hypothetical protein
LTLWEPQIRSNLEDLVYGKQLDELVANVPGAVRAGIVNVRFQEACLRTSEAQPGSAADVDAAKAMATSLFGDPEAVAPREAADAIGALGVIESAHICFREETLLVGRLGGDRVLLLTAAAALNQGACATLIRSHAEKLRNGSATLADVIEPQGDLSTAAIVDLRTATVVERRERDPDASVLTMDSALARTLAALLKDPTQRLGLRLSYMSGEPIEVRRVELVAPGHIVHWARLPFDPEHLLMLSTDSTALRGVVWMMIRRAEIEVIRLWVDGLLRYGVKSTMSPFPHTQKEFLAIVEELRALHENDLLGRLDIGGFANYTIGSGDDMQRCQECIYYLPNGKWCDLPELPVPVEPHWWCRLWKI